MVNGQVSSEMIIDNTFVKKLFKIKMKNE